MPEYVRKSIPSFVLILLGLGIMLLIPHEVVVLHETGINARTFPYIATAVIMVASAMQALLTIVRGWRMERAVAGQQAADKRERARFFLGIESVRPCLRVLFLFAQTIFAHAPGYDNDHLK